MSLPGDERREAAEPRRKEERLETTRPAQTQVIDRREDQTKMGAQPGQEVVTELTHQRPDMRTTQEIIDAQAAAAKKELAEADGPTGDTLRDLAKLSGVVAVAPARCACEHDGLERAEWCHHCERMVNQAESLEAAVEKARATGRPANGEDLAQARAQVTHVANDPWKHRAQGMRCATCMFYVVKHAPASLEEIGRCRRHAPTMGGYPAVFPADWCGDHKLDEAKV